MLKFKKINITYINNISSLVILTCLSACSFIPKYEQPIAPIASNYPHNTNNNIKSNASDIAWREFFQDKYLQQLIETSLTYNSDLKSAVLRIQEAKSLYNIQSSDLLPNINLGVGAGRSDSGNIGGQKNISNLYQIGANLASFELDLFGRVKSLNQAALNEFFATKQALLAVQISLVSEVAKAYLAMQAFKEQLELAKNALERREKAYQLAKYRFDNGITSALDLRLNETLVQSAKVALHTLVRQHEQAQNALVLLLGKPLEQINIDKNIISQTLSAQNIISDIPAGLPSELLTNRPDIIAAEFNLKAANANIGAAKAAFFPRIALTAGFGVASNELSNLFKSGSTAWSFASNLTLPIFDAGRNKNNLELAKVRQQQLVVSYEKSIQAAFREAADALVARQAILQQMQAQIQLELAQAERLKLAKLRYENGISNYTDVLNAEQELFSAQQSVVQTRLLHLTNATELYKALGGGLK